jgi:uncharacterized membrane protein
MYIKLYSIALPIFLAIDAVWLGIIAKNLYAKHLGYLMAPSVNFTAAILFYLIFIAGLVSFVIMPALEKGSWVHAILFGAFFGLICYATYDLTNLATVKDWPVLITAIDLIWGSLISALVSLGTYLIAVKIGL